MSNYILDWNIEKSSLDKRVGISEVMAVKSLIDDYPDIDAGNIIKIFDTGSKVFEGRIDFIDYKTDMKITSKELGDLLNHIYIIESYTNSTISYIVTDIISKYTDWSTSGIQTTTTTLEKYRVKDRYAFDVIKELGKVMNWTWRLDTTTKIFYFEPYGYTDSGKTFTIGGNARKIADWRQDRYKMKNKIKIFGKVRNMKTNKFSNGGSVFTFDGTGSVATLYEKPSSFVRIMEGTTELKGGMSGATLNPDYVVDADLKKLIKLSVPPNGSTWITEYDYSVENIIQVEDGNSASIYGEKDYMEVNPNLEERADVLAYANKLLAKYAEPFWTGKLEVTDMSVTPGTVVHVTDSINDIDSDFVAKEVKVLGLRRGSEVVLGDEEYRTYDYLNELDNRINKLEEKFKGEADVVQQVKSFVNPLNYDIHTHLIAKTRGMGSAFIIGHTTNSVLNSFYLGSPSDAWTIAGST